MSVINSSQQHASAARHDSPGLGQTFPETNISYTKFSEEMASEIVDEMLEHFLIEASVAKMRLDVLSDSTTQRELQMFLFCAVQSCESELSGEPLLSFLREATMAFMYSKITAS